MLTVTDIYKDYEGKPLLCGVSFEVAEHEIVSLLGASGSGKSTLLRIIAGLEPAASGQVCWQGQDLADTPVHKRQFGLMFQDYALFPHRSVAQNVAFGLRMQNLPKEEVEQRTQEALVMVHMQDFADRRVSDLSGGEQQRVALARSLAPRPRLLMLDEPLGALDHELRERLIVELRQILTQAGIPAIYVTHDHEEAYAIADRLLLLHDGVIKQQGAPQEVFQQPADVWVANFFGMGNLLAGTVISTDPLQVETTLGVFEAAAPAQPAFNKGEQVQVLLRPAAAQFGAGKNALNVHVVDVRFRGDHFEVRGETEAETSLRFFTAQEVSAGDSLRIHFPAESVQILVE
jgi:spermidine/putrescine transport system ATP-binding protein